MRRPLTLLVVVGLLVSAVPVVVGATPSTYASISQVTVTPEDPAPGESVTIRPTIRNLEDSPSILEIDAVALRTSEPRLIEYARVRDLGTLAPGSSLDVPLSVTFDRPGTKRLRVHLYGRDESGNRVHVQYPVIVSVQEQHPQLDVEFNETVATADGHGTVTVANGLSSAARNVELRLSSDTLEIADSRTIMPALDRGATTTERFRYRAPESGTHFVRAQLRYTVDGSELRRTTETVPVTVDPLRDNVVVEATRAGPPGSSRVAVDVINRGNLPIENVTVEADSASAQLPRRHVSVIPDQSSRTVVLNATMQDDRANVDVTATYDVGNQQGSASDDAELSATPGRIGLTGVNVEREGGRLHVTGSAANMGLTEANSVVVSVADTERVSPAYPTREFFVGTVPESDFVSFDVFARTSGNVSSIPVRVEYIVDGERRERIVRVQYRVRERPQQVGPEPGRSSGGLLVPAAIGGVVVVGVAAIIYVGWRNSRGGG